MKSFILLLSALMIINLSADFEFGKELLEDGLYDEAILEFEAVISSSPTSDEAQESMFHIGEIYLKQQKYAEAEKQFQRLLTAYPDNLIKDKLLFSLGFSRFGQDELSLSLQNFEDLIEKFPLSDQTKKALKFVAQIYFQQEEYNLVILKCRDFLENYEDPQEVPELKYWLVRAYLHNNMPQESEEAIADIKENHPNSDARWKLLDLEIERKETTDAAEILKTELKQNIPRRFEEKFRSMLVGYYLDLGKFNDAYEESRNILDKFNNSDKLDGHIITFREIQLRLQKYEEMIEQNDEYEKVFRESPHKDDFRLSTARAYFYLREYKKALQISEEISSTEAKAETNFAAEFLKAQIREKEGKFYAAIGSYRKLLSEYPQIDRKAELLSQIAAVYFDQLHFYQKALEYYEQLVENYPSGISKEKIIFRICLCYEQMREYNKALAILDRLDISAISEQNFREKVEAKRIFLQDFLIRDYETAFTRLTDSLFDFLGNDDKSNLKKELVEILVTDLKEYEKSAELLEKADSSDLLYWKAKIHLNLARKNLILKQQQKANDHLLTTNSVISKISDKKKIAELTLQKQLIIEPELSSEIVSQLEDFVKKYPQEKAADEFSYLLYKYYLEQDNEEKKIEFAEKIVKNKNISDSEFFLIKSYLAEYYLKADKPERAVEVYRSMEDRLWIDKPQVYYNYALVLYQSGEEAEAVNKLQFLLNNMEDPVQIPGGIYFLADAQVKMLEYQNALNTLEMTPPEFRDDAYYFKIASLQQNLRNPEAAKIALLHIKTKEDSTLLKLAELQYETADFEMAKYSYQQLLQKDKNNLKIYEILAEIEFQQEHFLKAAENYKFIYDSAKEGLPNIEKVEDFARNYAVSLYRIGNRPKAETVMKRFKDVLTENDLDVIELNEGIYYMEFDSKKAEKVFSKLLKKVKKAEVKYAAFFWRGVTLIKLEKNEEALADFQKVLNSPNIELRNKAHLKLGTLNFSGEEYQQSLDHYLSVIENDEKGELALDAARNFAFVCKTIEEWQKAVSAYEIILERFGDENLEAETVFNIAYCHLRDKKYRKAIPMFERALAILEEREMKAETQYWIAECYFHLENYSRSISEHLKVSYNYSDFPQWSASSNLRAGEAYIKLEKLSKARSIFRKIIDKYGKDSNWGKEAIKWLEKI